MLRQRNTKPEQEVPEHGGGFSIGLSSHFYHILSKSCCSGGFDDHMSVANGKMKAVNESCNCWKYIAVLLLCVTGFSSMIYCT